jgi:hypothetical protein
VSQYHSNKLFNADALTAAIVFAKAKAQKQYQPTRWLTGR